MSRNRRNNNTGGGGGGASNKGGGNKGAGAKGASANNNNNNNNNNRGGGANNKGSRKNRAPAAPSRDFWGTTIPLAEETARITAAPDATAVFRSLGPPPLAGHAAIAENYFTLVYERASGLATALAAAGGLLDNGGG